MKLSLRGMAFSLGLVNGLFMLILAWIAAYGLEKKALEVTTWFYPGFAASFWGGIIGFIWGFVSGAIFGFFVALFYNLCSCKCKK